MSRANFAAAPGSCQPNTGAEGRVVSRALLSGKKS
jgi:hypothetical protein